MVSFITLKEQGKVIRSVVGDSAAAINQSYKNPSIQPAKYYNSRKCWACHSPTNDRAMSMQKCPGWIATYPKCNIKGHFGKGCSKYKDCGTWGASRQQIEVLQRSERQHKQQSVANHRNKVFADQGQQGKQHHVFKWKFSSPQSIIQLSSLSWIRWLLYLREEHANLGNNTPRTVPMIANTVCQSSNMPLETVLSMVYDLWRNDIMPVSLSMRGAIKEDSGVQGGTILNVSIYGRAGEERSCKKLVYLSKKMT